MQVHFRRHLFLLFCCPNIILSKQQPKKTQSHHHISKHTAPNAIETIHHRPNQQ